MAYQYKREPLTKEQASRLEEACQTAGERMVVWVLLDTGLRVDELATLTRTQIDWQGKRLKINGKGGSFGSKSKIRYVPLSTRARALLEAHFALNEKFGKNKRTLQRIVKQVATRAELSKTITPHVLRHTFAVFSLQAGLSLASLMKILGHDRLETTQIYLNLSGEDAVREYLEKIG